MNDKNLINCLAQKQLKELDFEIKFNSSLKNKFNAGNSKNPFESNFTTASQGAFNNRNQADFKQTSGFSLFNCNYDKNANLVQKSDNSFGSFVSSSCGYQAASNGPSAFANPISNLPVQNFNSIGAINLTGQQNNNLPANLVNNSNPNLLIHCSSTTTNSPPNQQASNKPAFNGNPSLFGHTSLSYNSSLNSNQPFNRITLQSSPTASHQANASLNNFNPFLDIPTNQPNSQLNNRSLFNLQTTPNSTINSNLSGDLSSSFNAFSLLRSNNFDSLIDGVSSTNSLTQTHLPSQNKVTNCDLINLDSSSGHPVAEDKYSIFKEIGLSNDKIANENKTNKQQDNVKTDTFVDKREDRLFSSTDLNEDFGEFKSFGESFGEFKSYSDFSSKQSLDPTKISETDKLARFERLLNGVLSVFHRSFNVLNIYYDEKSVLSALSTAKGKEFYLDLKEVYYVSKRVGSSLAGMQSCEKLFNLIDEINKLWSLLDKMMSFLHVSTKDTSIET